MQGAPSAILSIWLDFLPSSSCRRTHLLHFAQARQLRRKVHSRSGLPLLNSGSRLERDPWIAVSPPPVRVRSQTWEATLSNSSC
ncbi:hypothetical protein EDB19DRAFT_1088359 [Suillus lakei]|nr:hypothetical protein EDB19DRAFT_1088359 [Suillus lakei]